MQWNDHSRIEGRHATFSASKYNWLNYTDDKLVTVYDTQGEYVEITPGRVSFMQNGTEVAYMTGKKLYIKNGDIEASDFKFVDGVSIKAQLEKLAKSVDNNGFDFEIDGGGWLRMTNSSSAAYAVELGSDGALRLVANSGDIFLKAGLATIQMHHDTGTVAISGLNATPVFG